MNSWGSLWPETRMERRKPVAFHFCSRSHFSKWSSTACRLPGKALKRKSVTCSMESPSSQNGLTGPGRRPRQRLLPLLLRVGAHALPVHHDDGLVPDHPGVVSRRQVRDLPGPRLELGTVPHEDVHTSRDLVLEVRRLAPLRAGDRLDVRRPLPARLQRGATEGPAADGAA